ncbi:MAG: hypothetical protein HFJ33_04955 [Clostridia bacterium]|nr:hypothetical protein [Clostridia bacterium]
MNKRIDKLYEDKYNGLLEDEDLEEKEDSLVDINKIVSDFVNMKEITRTLLFN